MSCTNLAHKFHIFYLSKKSRGHDIGNGQVAPKNHNPVQLEQELESVGFQNTHDYVAAMETNEIA